MDAHSTYAMGFFWAGRGLAAFGATLSSLAIPFMLTVSLGLDPVSASLVMAAPLVMNLLSPLYAGVMADALDRRVVMVLADVIRAVLLASLGVVVQYSTTVAIPALVVLNSLLAIASAVSNASFRAGFPDIVGESALYRANARLQYIGTVSSSAGGLLGGALMGALGAPPALFINAALVLISAGSAATVPWPLSAPSSRSGSRRKKLPYWRRVGQGFELVWQDRLLLSLVTASTLTNLFVSVGSFALLWLLVRINEFSYFSYVLVLSVGSVGAVLGALSSERISSRLTTPWIVQGTALLLYGTFLASYGFVSGNGWGVVVLCCALDLVIGFALSLYVISNSVQQQRIVGSAERGSVSAVRSFGNGLALAGGTALAGLGVSALDSHLIMFLSGLGIFVSGVVFLWRVAKHVRR